MPGQFVINLATGSLSFSFTLSAAQDLKKAIEELLLHLKTKEPGKTKPHAPTEYQFTGDVFFEVFCNPNIWPNPFAAKVLVTLRDDRIRVSTETELTAMIADLDMYIEQQS
jgi:hypothetical protein